MDKFDFQAQAAAAQAELAGTNSDGVKFGGMGDINNLLGIHSDSLFLGSCCWLLVVVGCCCCCWLLVVQMSCVFCHCKKKQRPKCQFRSLKLMLSCSWKTSMTWVWPPASNSGIFEGLGWDPLLKME